MHQTSIARDINTKSYMPAGLSVDTRHTGSLNKASASSTAYSQQATYIQQEAEQIMLPPVVGYDFSKIGIQPRLKVSHPSDPSEEEAERVAEQVMSTPAPSIDSHSLAPNGERLDRKCAACETMKEKEEKEVNISRKSSSGFDLENNHELASEIGDIRSSSGSLLDASTKEFMESRFGYDFSSVRVHTDGTAAQSANRVNALAYTIGNNIVFGEGMYQPDTTQGRRLLAHELTHVVQQNGNKINAKHSSDNIDIRVNDYSNNTTVQRFGDPAQIPSGMSCPVAVDTPLGVVENLLFSVGTSALSTDQQTQIESFVNNWHALGGNFDVRVDGYASVDGPQGLNWTLSCDRAQAVVNELITPSSGVPGIPSSFITFFAHGETDEFSTSNAPNRRATISSNMPAPPTPPACPHPGELREVELQPVVFKSTAADPAPTGVTWTRRFTESNVIWNKIGVHFSERAPVEIIDAARKTAGNTDAEVIDIAGQHSGTGIEVFMVDNDLPSVGGGGTINSGTASAKVVIADRGTSDTLLAHELGHVLGLEHPGTGTAHDGEAGTIMEPSGSHSVANPTRNTITNFNRIVFPAPIASICLNPDP
ncbi:MAG: DUF4157 domain-containing protein [Nitrososphaera sp.]